MPGYRAARRVRTCGSWRVMARVRVDERGNQWDDVRELARVYVDERGNQCMWMSVAISGRVVLAFQFSCDSWPEPRLKGVQSATAERESAPPLKP